MFEQLINSCTLDINFHLQFKSQGDKAIVVRCRESGKNNLEIK